MADAVTAQGPDGRLLFANDAAVRTLGFDSTEELLSAPTTAILDRFEIFDEDGRALPARGAARPPRARRRGRGRGGGPLPRAATGEERWAAVKATPIRDADGNVRMAINVIEDITAHKRAELAQRFLARSAEVLASSLDSDELLVQVAHLAVPEMADWWPSTPDRRGGLERWRSPRRPRGARVGARAEQALPAGPGRPAGRPPGDPHRRGRALPRDPRRAAARGTQDEEHYRMLSELGMRSAMVVPMAARGRTLGALTFATGPSGRRFDEHDVELAEELGRRCATAVDNARLYSERAYIARTLQESLLPAELPEIPGIEAAARFRPTGEGNEVGGDFYDLFETGSRGWTVVMGDVCGKGPDAAAVTALARYTLRAAAMRERLPSRSLPCSTRRCCASATTAASARSPMPTREARPRRPRGLRQRRPSAAAAAARRRHGGAGRGARHAARRGAGPGPRGPRGRARAGRRARLLHGRRDRGPRRRGDPRRAAAGRAGRGLRRRRGRRDCGEDRGGGGPSQGGRPRDDIAVLVLRVRVR